MVEAQSVENLVLHDARVQTASSLQGDQLSTTLTAQVGPTPRSIKEVEVLPLPTPPDKANAGVSVEGQQSSDDKVTLVTGVSPGDDNRHVDVAISTFRPHAAFGGAGDCIPASALPNVTILQFC